MTHRTIDDLDSLDLADMDAPTLITARNGLLTATISRDFPGFTDAWEVADPAERRNLLLHVGNAHIGEIRIGDLVPVARDRAIGSVLAQLPVDDISAYARVIASACRDERTESSDKDRRLTEEERESYRRCLIVRATAYGGSLELPIFALASGIVPEFRSAAHEIGQIAIES